MTRQAPDFEIEWIIADHNREQLEPVVEIARKVLPSWVVDMVIRYNPRLDAIAKVNCNPEYRNLIVQIGDQWFSESDSNRRIHLLHEFSHGLISSVSKVYVGLLEAYTEDGSPQRKWGEETMRIAEETVVSDLSRVFDRLLSETVSQRET